MIWYSGGYFHIVYNYWNVQRAYHLMSKDGVTKWTSTGIAYQASQSPANANSKWLRYTDGTVNQWHNMERPGVYQENGHVRYFTFAVTDVDKNASAVNNGGSKILVVPFDGVQFDCDNGDAASCAELGAGGAGGAGAGGAAGGGGRGGSGGGVGGASGHGGGGAAAGGATGAGGTGQSTGGVGGGRPGTGGASGGNSGGTAGSNAGAAGSGGTTIAGTGGAGGSASGSGGAAGATTGAGGAQTGGGSGSPGTAGATEDGGGCGCGINPARRRPSAGGARVAGKHPLRCAPTSRRRV